MNSKILSILFSFFILITIVLFTIFYNYQSNKYYSQMGTRYISVAQIVIFSMMHKMDQSKINEQINPIDISLIAYDPVIFDPKNIYQKFTYPKITIEVYLYEGKIYPFIKHMHQKIYLEDMEIKKFQSVYYFLFFFSALGMLGIVYFAFIKKEIENKKARDLFIANIMHELKTPVTKGKLTITLLNDPKNAQRLDKVFNRLETLVNEFAFIEELTSNYTIERRKYRLTDIVDNGIDLLLEDVNIEKNFLDKTLYVNYNLLSICIKNLLDNGIKYSTDKKVILCNEKETILTFQTKGEPLQKPLEFYTQPFTKEKAIESFGLGLYIVKYILDFHHLKLKYRYENGYNYFTIV